MFSGRFGELLKSNCIKMTGDTNGDKVVNELHRTATLLKSKIFAVCNITVIVFSTPLLLMVQQYLYFVFSLT